jgi:hypothetical protein
MMTKKGENIIYQISNVLSLTSMSRFHHLQMFNSFGGFAMPYITLKINNDTNDDSKC